MVITLPINAFDRHVRVFFAVAHIVVIATYQKDGVIGSRPDHDRAHKDDRLHVHGQAELGELTTRPAVTIDARWWPAAPAWSPEPDRRGIRMISTLDRGADLDDLAIFSFAEPVRSATVAIGPLR